MVIPFPVKPRAPDPHTADLAALLQHLRQAGPGGQSEALHAALQRQGCGSPHDLLLRLLQQRVASGGPAVGGPPAQAPQAYVPY